jgi:DNA-directed RNA polymerase subunit omega
MTDNNEPMLDNNENTDNNLETEENAHSIDSKYRLILIAAQRSKQLQKGARPRVSMDLKKHKPTRVALEEIKYEKINFKKTED